MNDKYWEEEIETMPREKLRELQLQRLKKQSVLQQILPITNKYFKSTALQRTVFSR
jgi:phenylacetate-CoA ligase (EC 6.2.1.30)